MLNCSFNVCCVCRKVAGEATSKIDASLSSDQDDDESVQSTSALDLVKSRFIEYTNNDCNLLPDWFDDNDLKNSTTETLSTQEEEFWKKLIEKYLEPIEPSEEEKV